MENTQMVMASPSPANDQELNEQLNASRDAAIDNLRDKSTETRQQYFDEIEKLEDQKRRSAEVVQTTIDSARENNARQTEAEYANALKNAQTAVNSWQHRGLNHLSQDTPQQVHANIVRTAQELVNAQEAYLAYHPEDKDNPDFQLHVAEDGEGNFTMQAGPAAELAEQTAVASLDDARELPLDELRKIVQRQRDGRSRDVTKPLVSFVDNPDGSYDAVLQTGEIFKGFTGADNREAIRKMAEGRINTQRHYQSLLESAVSAQPANDQQPMEQPQVERSEQPSAQPGNETPSDPNAALSSWVAEQALAGLAHQFGYSTSAEFIADQNARYQRELYNNQLLEDFQNKQIVATFFAAHPEYPQGPVADDALEKIMTQNGWEWTPSNMGAAHLVAMQRGMYRPLSPEDMADGYAPQERRRTPPPMPPNGNPDLSRPTEDVNTMPLDQLRKQILAAQMGGR
jgi:hypothetical protein